MIQPVSAFSPKVFKGNFQNGQPKTSQEKTEEKMAKINAIGLSLVAGALTTAIARSYTASLKNASIFGIGATCVTALFAYPKFLYKNKFSKLVKESNLDTFSKERDLPKKTVSKLRRI